MNYRYLLILIGLICILSPVNAMSWTLVNGCYTSTYNGYNYVQWNTVGTSTWPVPTGTGPIEYIIVGAGGGIAGDSISIGGVGGGGGTYLHGHIPVSGTVTITVGGGALRATGGSSSFAGLTATGGTYQSNPLSRTGGSNANYTGGTYSSGSNSGGGAGGCQNGPTSMNGGNGCPTGTFFDVNYYFAGGGGGFISGVGGYDHGGNGSASGTDSPAGYNGTFPGGGGGGTGNSSMHGGSKGGDGVVYIRYQYASQFPEAPMSVTGYADIGGSGVYSIYSHYIVNDSLYSYGSGVAATTINQIDTPENGGWIGVTTTEPEIYHQEINNVGYGGTYNGSANAGTSYSLRTSDSASSSIEARGTYADIYQTDGTRVGTYTGGGTMRSVSMAVKNGLWAAAGGDDGKLYVFSKDATSGWYLFYNGDSSGAITKVAMSWGGDIECVGESTGNLECFYNGVNVNTSAFTNFEVFVYRNGAPYQTYVQVEESLSYPYIWHSFGTNISTDTNGKAVVLNSVVGKYYRLTAGPEQQQVIYTSSTTTNQVLITIDTAEQILNGFNYSAEYNSTYPGNITVHYHDITTPNSVIIKIGEKTTGKIVYSQEFDNQANINAVYKGNPNVAYEIQWVWDRDGVRGMAGKTIFVPAGGGFNFGNIDQNVKYALFYILFLVICGLFTYATRTIGAFISAIFYAFLVFLQLLPFTLINIAGMLVILTLAAVFGDAKEKR